MFIDINKLVAFRNVKDRPKIAKVIANNDPTARARIKVQLEGLFDPEDAQGSNLPWIRQEGSSFNGVQQFQVPDVGSLVELCWKFGSRIPTYKPAPYESNNYVNHFSSDYPYCWGWADNSGFTFIVNRKNKSFTIQTTGTLISGDSEGNIVINGGNITIQGSNITVQGSDITIQGNTKIDDKVFLEHKHSNGHEGADTGGVV